MAFSGSFTVQQLNETDIQLTDNSTGSDPTITERRISLIIYNTTTLVPSGTNTTYILWTIIAGIGDTITIQNILSKDYAVEVQVLWYTPTPDPTNTYLYTQLALFEYFNMLELGGLITEKMARDPNIIRDNDFINNFFAFYCAEIGARISVGLLNDIFKAQFCLEIATNMRNQQNLYF